MLTKIATIDFPTRFGDFDLTTYETSYSSQPEMRYAIVICTKVIPTLPLVRVQSSCIFGEVFHNKACDCGEQLEQSLELIQKQGGILVYLDQEGRGHGIIAKTKELQLQQSEGLDTVEASEKLNLKPDDRDFTVVADILRQMNIPTIKLLTNNPKKIRELEMAGIEIDQRVPLEIEVTEHNKKYLQTKQSKLGHMLNLGDK